MGWICLTITNMGKYGTEPACPSLLSSTTEQNFDWYKNKSITAHLAFLCHHGKLSVTKPRPAVRVGQKRLPKSAGHAWRPGLNEASQRQKLKDLVYNCLGKAVRLERKTSNGTSNTHICAGWTWPVWPSHSAELHTWLCATIFS